MKQALPAGSGKDFLGDFIFCIFLEYKILALFICDNTIKTMVITAIKREPWWLNQNQAPSLLKELF